MHGMHHKRRERPERSQLRGPATSLLPVAHGNRAAAPTAGWSAAAAHRRRSRGCGRVHQTSERWSPDTTNRRCGGRNTPAERQQRALLSVPRRPAAQQHCSRDAHAPAVHTAAAAVRVRGRAHSRARAATGLVRGERVVGIDRAGGVWEGSTRPSAAVGRLSRLVFGPIYRRYSVRRDGRLPAVAGRRGRAPPGRLGCSSAPAALTAARVSSPRPHARGSTWSSTAARCDAARSGARARARRLQCRFLRRFLLPAALSAALPAALLAQAYTRRATCSKSCAGAGAGGGAPIAAA